MIIGIAGAAGSGKDTCAALMGKYISIVNISQAAPMKRFAGEVFGFSKDQLFGPSESRNAPDTRFDTSPAWEEARLQLALRGRRWIDDVLPGLDGDQKEKAFQALRSWFYDMAKVHGFELRDGSMVPTLESLFPAFEKRTLTARYVLQTIGTEWGRQFSPNMWNDYATRTALKLLAGGYSHTNETGLVADAGQTGPEAVGITDVRFRNEVLGIRQAGGLVLNITSPAEDNASVEAAGVKGHKSEAELKGIPRKWFTHTLVNDKSHGLLALENLVCKFVRDLPAPISI